jgi:hypothetical protein
VLRTRSRIILVELESEPQRDAAPAPNLTFNIADYQKCHKLNSFLLFPLCFNQKEIGRNIALALTLTFACFKEVGWVYSRVGGGAGAATNFLPYAVAASKWLFRCASLG